MLTMCEWVAVRSILIAVICTDLSIDSMYRPSSRLAPRTFCPFVSEIKYNPDWNVVLYFYELSCPSDRRGIRNSEMKNTLISTPTRCTIALFFVYT